MWTRRLLVWVRLVRLLYSRWWSVWVFGLRLLTRVVILVVMRIVTLMRRLALKLINMAFIRLTSLLNVPGTMLIVLLYLLIMRTVRMLCMMVRLICR